jgi:hypothetical protein
MDAVTEDVLAEDANTESAVVHVLTAEETPLLPDEARADE